MKSKASIFVLLFFLNLVIPGENCENVRQYIEEALALRGNPKHFKKIEALYKKAIRLNPRCAEAHNNLGDLYENVGRFDDAIREYETAVQLAPDEALSYFGLGDVYYKTNRVDEAITWYEKGLKYDPEDTATKDNLVKLHDIKEKGVIRAETIKRMLTKSRTRGITNTVTPMNTPPSLSFNDKLIPFDFDKWHIRPDARKQLNEIGKALEGMDFGNDSIVVIGHTDVRGTEKYNDWLSMKRAQSVVDYLTTYFELKRAIFRPVGKGEMVPLCLENSESCHAVNRRVEIEIKN